MTSKVASRAKRANRPWVAYGAAAVLLLLGVVAVYVVRDYYGTAPEELTVGDVWRVRIAVCALVLWTTLALVLLGHRISKLILAMRAGRAGSRFHIRLARRFALIGILPACLIAILSLLTVVYGLDRWFSSRVGDAVRDTRELADAFDGFLADDYRQGQQLRLEKNLGEVLARVPLGDTRTLAERLTDLGASVGSGEGADREWAATANLLFNLPVSADRVALFAGTELLRAGKWDGARPDPEIEADAVRQAVSAGVGVPVSLPARRDADPAAGWIAEAVVALPPDGDLILYVEHAKDAAVVDRVRAIRTNAAEYEQVARSGLGVAWGFALIYGIGAVVVAVAAIVVGFLFADQMVGPIGRLAGAASRIESGDLSARIVEQATRSDEIGNLVGTFNRMAASLQHQREELLVSREREREGRRFAEGVLRGATVGIVGIDSEGRIQAANRAASDILGADRNLAPGASVHAAMPEIRPLLARARGLPGRVSEAEVNAESEQVTRQLLVRVAPEVEGGSVHGYVVTIEDITGRAVAERMEAWKHLAEIMAHEIKNPLNPLMLKAEALQEMVPPAERERQERMLAANTELVVRIVEQIRRLVDDFRNFASMPEPHLERVDLAGLASAAVDLVRAEDRDAEVSLGPARPISVRCDRTQLSRALANVLRNASLATRDRAQREIESGRDPTPRRIRVSMVRRGRLAEVTVEDNGSGFPADARERLLEPYVSHRKDQGGTGLGLAVVRWIMESHDGEVLLRDPPDGARGAVVRLRLPVEGPQDRQAIPASLETGAART